MALRLIAGAVSLVRTWTWLYTYGLPTQVRDARRLEIESDLWEFLHDTDRAGSVTSSVHLLVRLLRGVPDDLTWRADHAVAEHRSLALRVVVAVLVVAASGTAAFLLDTMRARQLPKPPPVTRDRLRISPTPPSPLDSR
jgi:hypothetical protein